MTEQQREQRGISRRTIAKGAAWAVPALPIVAATPAYATSGGGPTGRFLDACKQPGASCDREYGFVKGYTFTVSFTNSTSETVYIYPTTTSPNGLPPYFEVTSSVPFSYSTARLYTGGAIGAPLSESLAIGPGATVTIIINAGTNSNSANTDAVGVLYMAWGHTSTVGADPDHPYTPAPPAANTGEGWIRVPFSFPSTPPCTDCAPGGDATDTEVVPESEVETLESTEVAPEESTESLVETPESTDVAPEDSTESLVETPESTDAAPEESQG